MKKQPLAAKVTINIDRSELKPNEGVRITVAEASSMGDYTHLGAIEALDGQDTVEMVVTDRQVIEVRPFTKHG